jgi:hypothetical protein
LRDFQPYPKGFCNERTATKPSLFVVGAPKCGTTSLDRYLRAHPEIFMSQKEPHYFATDMPEPKQPVRVSEREEYMKWFRTVSNEEVIGETSPWYLYSEVAAERIHSFNPEARILCILRDPVDLILSLHQMNVTSGTETEVELADALGLEEERRKGKSIPDTTHLPWDLYYRDAVRFTDQLDRFRSRFDDEQVRVLIFERFTSQTADVYREVTEFLGVSPNFQPDFETHNERHPVRNLGIRRFIRRYAGLGRLLNQIPEGIRSVGGDIVSWFSDSVQYKRDPSQPVCDTLRSELTTEVQKLDSTVSVDLSTWWPAYFLDSQQR